MTWNHRVVRRRYKMKSLGGRSESFYSIAEVFYNGRGKPKMFTVEPIAPGGTSLKDLRHELAMMLMATYKPVFRKSEIGRRKNAL